MIEKLTTDLPLSVKNYLSYVDNELANKIGQEIFLYQMRKAGQLTELSEERYAEIEDAIYALQGGLKCEFKETWYSHSHDSMWLMCVNIAKVLNAARSVEQGDGVKVELYSYDDSYTTNRMLQEHFEYIDAVWYRFDHEREAFYLPEQKAEIINHIDRSKKSVHAIEVTKMDIAKQLPRACFDRDWKFASYLIYAYDIPWSRFKKRGWTAPYLNIADMLEEWSFGQRSGLPDSAFEVRLDKFLRELYYLLPIMWYPIRSTDLYEFLQEIYNDGVIRSEQPGFANMLRHLCTEIVEKRCGTYVTLEKAGDKISTAESELIIDVCIYTNKVMFGKGDYSEGLKNYYQELLKLL